MSLRGYLREICAAPKNAQACSSYYVFVTDNNKVYEKLNNSANAPINTHIEVVIDNSNIISWDYTEKTVFSYLNETYKDIALVKIVPVGKLNEKVFLDVEEEANDLEDYLKHVNDGLWDHISVTPYAIENSENQMYGPTSFNFNKIKDKLRKQHPDKVDQHNYWHGWAGSHQDYLGLAYRGGSIAWTYASGQRTMRHEQGHNFGCPHSSTDDDEYGDPTCVMARAHSGFNALQMTKLGHIHSKHQRFISLNEQKTMYLCPVEVSAIDVREGEYKSVVLENPDTRKVITISTRKGGHQSILGTKDSNRLFIHSSSFLDREQRGNPRYITDLSEGEVFKNEGITVKHSGSNDGIIKVEINQTKSLDEYPSSLAVISSDEFKKEHSAIWHNPEYKFQGIDFHMIPEENRFVGYWFTHRPRGDGVDPNTMWDISSRMWYVIDGTIDPETNIAHCDIYKTYNRVLEKSGHGVIRLNGDSMMFRYYTEDFGRDHMLLEPLSNPKDDDISGIYETGDYEGFSVGKYGNQFVVYHFTYEKFSSKKPEWIVYQGSNIESLKGYIPNGRYKITYEKTMEQISSINLNDILQSANKVL